MQRAIIEKGLFVSKESKIICNLLHAYMVKIQVEIQYKGSLILSTRPILTGTKFRDRYLIDIIINEILHMTNQKYQLR